MDGSTIHLYGGGYICISDRSRGEEGMNECINLNSGEGISKTVIIDTWFGYGL